MLTKKLFRTMWKYKAQFISMVIMIILGVGIFVGFNVEWHTIEQNTDVFFEETGYADYRIVSTSGYSEQDASSIVELYGQDNVTRFNAIDIEITSGAESAGDYLALTYIDNYNVSSFIVNSGQEYDAEDDNGIWLSEKYALYNDIEVGDSLQLVYNGSEINGVVRALIQSSEYTVCFRDATQMLPDYTTYGYAYVSPALIQSVIGFQYYSQIHVITDDSISVFSQNVDDVFGVTSLVVAKEDSTSYAGVSAEISDGKLLAEFLPIIFLLIAVLIMITTMYRVTIKERTQIGTLKALGFRNSKILLHYTLYAVIVGVVGIALGVGLGYLLAYIIMNPDGLMGAYLDMPYWQLSAPIFCYFVLALVFAVLVIVCMLSVRNILKGSASEILRPGSDEKSKPLKLERSRWFGNRSFGMRWNLRDILRHKMRTAISLLGVVGCMVILIASFGANDSMNSFNSLYFEEGINYQSRIYLSSDITDGQLQSLLDSYQCDTSSSNAVKIEDKTISLDIYDIQNNFVYFVSLDGTYIELVDSGAYICRRISEDYNLSIGDTVVVSPYGSDVEYCLVVAGIVCSNIENIVINQTYADSLDIQYTIDSLYVQTAQEDIVMQDGMSSILTKEEFVSTIDEMMEIMDTMIIMFIVIGIILSVVVLYNLGTLSYTERYREMATLKVLGFTDKQIARLLIIPNICISFVGIIIGIPLGIWTLSHLLDVMVARYEMLMEISVLSYVLSIVINVGVSLAVSLMVACKNKKINMVEALKSAE